MDDQTRDRLARGREHYRANEYDLAEPYLRALADADGPFADVYDMLGVIYYQRGRVSDAQVMFERALRINPAYTDAALNLAVTYNDLGKYQEAKAIYQKMVDASKNAPSRLDPYARGKLANMHADLGAAYRDCGLYAESVREYEKALALGPGFHDIRTQLGATLREMGNLDAAIHTFEQVRLDKPDYIPARLQLGLTLYGLGRRGDALDEWQQILGLEPSNKPAAMYIAMVNGQPPAQAAAPLRLVPEGADTHKLMMEAAAPGPSTGASRGPTPRRPKR